MKCDHTSVEILIKCKDKILLIKRKNFPFGFASLTGHMDEGKEFEDAQCELRREVGRRVIDMKGLV